MNRADVQMQKDPETVNLSSFYKQLTSFKIRFASEWHFERGLMDSQFAKMPYSGFAAARETFLEKSRIKTQVEVAITIGLIDVTAEMQQSIYIFELRVDQVEEKFLVNWRLKKIEIRYLRVSKDIIIVNVNFSSSSCNISNWIGLFLYRFRK